MSKLQLFINVKWWKTICLIAMISLVSAAAFAQGIAVRGRVLDDKGEPLVGATIKATGTQNAVTADASGNFSITVPTGTASITITFIGYVDVVKPIATGNPNLGTITMAANARDLNEVVVVGYGALKRTDVTGTVTSIDAKVLQEIPAATVTQQLVGRVAGLDIVNGNITIRGARTITAGSNNVDRPLIVVDGVPFYNDISNINPTDIKSVDVLKGASSTAIYGSRGSGGVILITTNRGRVGRSQVSYDTYIGVNRLQGKLKTEDAEGYARLKDVTLEGAILQGNAGATPYGLTPAETAARAKGVNNDWVNLLVKDAIIWDQNLRVSSGTEKTQFNTALGYRTSSNDNLQPNNSTKRITFNINIDHQISKALKIGGSIRNTLRLQDRSGGDQLGTAQWYSPLAEVYDAAGNMIVRPLVGQNDESTGNPLLRAQQRDQYYDYERALVSDNIVYAELKPIDHLTYKYTINYNYSQSNRGQYNGINGTSIANIAATTASTTNNSFFRVAQEHLLTYDNTFGKHHLNLTGVFTAERNHTENSNVNAQGIPSDANKNSRLSMGTVTGTGGSWSELGFLSYVGRANYTFNNRYNVTATMRADGNSTLADGKKWTSYPSVGLGWTITNEDFMKKYDFVDNLKLRAGYGENSTINNSAYQTLGQLDNAAYQYGGLTTGNSQGVRSTNLVNPTLTWQRTAETNIALDFALFRNRISGSIEVFRQKTTGIILPNILPSTLGAASQNANLGTTENKGIEFTLSTVNIQNLGGFSWSSDFNIGFIREKILELPNGSMQNINSGQFVGQPLSVIYDVRKIGIWQLSDATQTGTLTYPATTGTTYPVYGNVRGQTSPLQWPGQIRVEDVNKDGKIDFNDNQIIGHFNPNYTFGFTNRVSYKGFDASLVITARMGFTTLVPYVSSSNSGTTGWQFLNTGRHNQPVIDYWTPRNPTNAFPMPNNQRFPDYMSTLQYYDGSFIRAKALNLGYNLPSGIAKTIGLSSLRVYANVTNPFVIYSPVSNYSFSVVDPESVNATPVGSSTNGNIAQGPGNTGNRSVGLNAGTQRREFYFGINARF
ncbi:SusC/RagA family TonB-linked outer membrane protein [Mucilaginibacter calamicampi]|uniref:SusC/RagA family TonB-linked outer membrane protein n=1 Tax=Mucilaginibacter calamicampi TaxID=1302352 RepID=A0ABW2YXY6_9SPHI